MYLYRCVNESECVRATDGLDRDADESNNEGGGHRRRRCDSTSAAGRHGGRRQHFYVPLLPGVHLAVIPA